MNTGGPRGVRRGSTMRCAPHDGDCVHDIDAVVVDPVLEFVGVKADEAADLHDRDAPFVGQAPHVALARAEPLGDVVEREERGGGTHLAAIGAAEYAIVLGMHTSSTSLSFRHR